MAIMQNGNFHKRFLGHAPNSRSAVAALWLGAYRLAFVSFAATGAYVQKQQAARDLKHSNGIGGNLPRG